MTKNQESSKRNESEDNRNDEEILTDLLPIPPDGGYGWVIVAVSFMCNVIVDGIGYSFGIFLSDFVVSFDESRSKVSLVGSLLCGVYLCVGPVVSGLTNKFGCRPVTIAGSIIGAVAFVLARFSPNIEILILTYGVMGGIGFGMVYLPAIVSVGHYFESKRAIATGIAVCGSGVGTFIFSPFTKALLDWFDWKNALLIMAGIIFNGCVCGMLMRPLEPSKKKKTKNVEVESPRTKIILHRVKEQAKRNRKHYSMPESSGIGPTDTTEILVKVKGAKLKKEKLHEDTESEILSLPIAFFEKDKTDKSGLLRQDIMQSKRRRLQKLSSERGDEQRFPETPVATPKIPEESKSASLLKVSGDQNEVELLSSSPSNSSFQPQSPSEEVENPLRKRSSADSANSPTKTNGSLPPGVYVHEIQPLIRIEAGSPKSASHAMLSRSLGGSKNILGSIRSIDKGDYSRPLYRKDIFYSGSVINIPEYKSQTDMTNYIASITTIPGALWDEPECKLWRYCPCLPKPIKDILQEMMDVSLLTNIGFMLLCFGNIFAMLGFYVPYVYFVDKAELHGINKTKAAFLLSVIGITNVIGRPLSGAIVDYFKGGSLIINNVAMAIAGVAIFLTPFCVSYESMCVAASVFGLCTGAYISLTSTILCHLFGLEKLTNSFGLLTFFRGIASAIGPPVAGAVFQATGNYDVSFFLGGGLFLLGTGLHSVLHMSCIKSCYVKKAKSPDNFEMVVKTLDDKTSSNGKPTSV
ncbi:hypothetical protein CHS0354_019156 [Potamilus streckersoni]|uniref:Uncharacterized protein n=1 Tax=Potamilus streckersoni TaxID=2493646 RepID=A0AAE0W5G3_9BIVA|nr:hypothetical protein CHS0354_019156 [Potamilus streckersoni]